MGNVHFFAHGFNFAPAGFLIRSRGFGTEGRAGWTSVLRNLGDGTDHEYQSLDSIFTIFFLGTVLLGLDYYLTIAADAMISHGEEPAAHGGRQRRITDIKAQVNGTCDLVDVLASRTLGANSRELDLVVFDGDVRGNAYCHSETDDIMVQLPGALFFSRDRKKSSHLATRVE